MPIKAITDIHGFNALAQQWDELYALDSEANLFLSWQWLSDNFIRHPNRPFTILAWYNSTSPDQVQALLPLSNRILLNKSTKRFEPIVGMAGSYWADYTGLLCNPRVEKDALTELSDYLATMPVYQIRLDGLRMSNARQQLLFSAFSADKFKRKVKKPKDNDGKTDLSIAPALSLPTTSEQWLNSLSASTRQKLRRYRRQLDSDDNMTIRRSNTNTLEADLSQFAQLWTNQWQHIKGHSTQKKAHYYSELLRNGFHSGHLYLNVLTYKKKMVAATAVYTDSVIQQKLFFVSCRNKEFKLLPAGLLLHADNILNGISKQYKRYDFLRGDEAYKYSLGATDTVVESLRFSPKHAQVQARLLPRPLKHKALMLLKKNQRNGAYTSIEIVYSQLLESYPNDSDVLRQYRNWLLSTGNQRAANAIDVALTNQPTALS